MASVNCSICTAFAVALAWQRYGFGVPQMVKRLPTQLHLGMSRRMGIRFLSFVCSVARKASP